MALTETTISQPDLNLAAFRDERFAADRLGVSVETMRTWRRQKRGPRYRKIGGRCMRYSIADLLAFIEVQPAGGSKGLSGYSSGPAFPPRFRRMVAE